MSGCSSRGAGSRSPARVAHGRSRPAGARRTRQPVVGLGNRSELDDTQFVLPRIEPPVDPDYLAMTRVLDLVDRHRTVVVNDPKALRDVCEHTWALQFDGLAPATVVTADGAELAGFIDSHRRAVIKPLDGFGGSGVFLATVDDPNLASVLESATRRFSRLVVAQEWLPEVRQATDDCSWSTAAPSGRSCCGCLTPPDFRIGPPCSLGDWTESDLAVASRIGPDWSRWAPASSGWTLSRARWWTSM